MTRRFTWVLLLAIAVLFTAGIAWLFKLRLSQGDLFPAYSTLRADALGTRALFEALQELPELDVQRSVQPIKKLGGRPPSTIVMAGMPRENWDEVTAEEANILEAAVRDGSRLVVAFRAERASVVEAVKPFIKKTGSQEKKGAGDKAKDEKAKDEKAEKSGKGDEKDDVKNARTSPRNDEEKTAREKPVYADWEKRWGVVIRERWITDGDLGALKKTDAPESLEASVPWKSDLYFETMKGADWCVLYTRGLSPVMVEMPLGKGSVVLATDAFLLSNEAMQKNRGTQLLAWLIGGNARVVFTESHLGVVEDTGIAMLARRYGLAGAFFVLLLLAALFVWQRMALFVPPPPESAETALSYHPTAGLESLLRRSVPANKLVDACVAEWARSGRASETDKARVETAVGTQSKETPADTYNAIVRALKRR